MQALEKNKKKKQQIKDQLAARVFKGDEAALGEKKKNKKVHEKLESYKKLQVGSCSSSECMLFHRISTHFASPMGVDGSSPNPPR